MKNYGLIIEPQVPEDFVFGSDNSLSNKFRGREVLEPEGNWGNYLPINEKQAPSFETNACVSFGTLNAIEILKKRQYLNDDNLSDRFVAKLSGTDPRIGNTPKKVGDTIRKNWSVFENEYATSDATNVDEFYQEIPNSLKTLAIGRGAEYEFGYEIVNPNEVREALKYSPLAGAIHAWVKGEDGIYYKPQGATENHWVCIWGIQPNGNYLILDTYYPFIKEYRGTPSIIFGYHLNRQVVNDSPFKTFLKQLEEIFASLVNGEVPRYPDDVPHETAEAPKPVIRDNGWRGSGIAHRKEMYKLALEIGMAEGLNSYKSKLLPDTHTLLDDYLATIEGESGFNQWCINFQSKDYGIAQFSARYYLKEYKMTEDEALQNPRKCLEIMAKNFKSKRRENWIAFQYAKKRLLDKTLSIYA